jgi:hypothetical protein
MPLIDGFPAVSHPDPAAVNQFELGKDLNGLIARNSAGVPRTGVLYRNNTALITARADMGVDIAAFEGVSLRSDGVILNAHYGASAPALTLDAAPVANSRIDVIYYVQEIIAAGDASDGPEFGFVKGTAAASPVKPTLSIDGAVELGTVQIPSTATATNSAGVVITTTAQFTANTGGIVVCRNTTELAAWTPGDGSFSLTLSDSALWQRISGAWKRVLSPGTPYAEAAGTGSNLTGSNTTVTFPAGRFTVAPIVMVTNTGNSTWATNAQNITSTNCQIAGYNPATGTAVAATWSWHAIQMTPTTAAG